MSQLTEIRWHARAGQGAVTAAKLVADTALLDGAYIQAMPEYGPERMGAPLKAYTRISTEPIEVHNNITNPTIVIVLDDTLLGTVDVLEGMPDDGTVILNTEMTPDQARVALGAPAAMRIATVDATGLALSMIGRDVPNTPIVGALSRVTGIIPIENVKKRLVITFGKKFTQKMVDANLECAERAYQEVRE